MSAACTAWPFCIRLRNSNTARPKTHAGPTVFRVVTHSGTTSARYAHSFRLPNAKANAAIINADEADRRGASHKIGQTGERPVPKKNIAAEKARQRTIKVLSLSFKAMNQSPERAPYKSAKLRFRKMKASSAVECDVTMSMRPQLQCN